MVEEIATVVSCSDEGVWLTTTPVATCNTCQVNDDCGTGIVAKTLTARKHHFFVPCTLKLLPGEQVKIGLAEQSLLMAALMVYMLPLLLLLTLALLANALGLNEGGVVLFGFSGGFAGFIIARRYGQYQEKHTHIHIIDVLPSLGIQQQIR
ncbi:SoxR reducing system RseC family protein [Rheinheimera baltica]|uniref:SoxR reducing system RseC family protein n=1 Tax=Rheinheimera baltica TaxID=67576 RepID=UPI00273EA809|nr:SoxR reducing system RseC family protein [Rheinheimera baltica]MDP5143997.1 SoxR reducing system RseC family protein [Rheinheimera baltica]